MTIDGNGVVLDGAALDTQARLDRIVRQAAESRIYFCERMLGLELEDWQREEFEALDAGATRVSIRSGNGVGKTFFCAITGLHFLLFRSECKIIITSPSSQQLSDGLYPEAIKWHKRLPPFLRQSVNFTTLRAERLDNADNAFMSFRTARKETPEALAGVHSRHVLCIVDEASGVAEEVYEAAQGTLSTAGAIFILIGNPTRLSGYFYNTHNKIKHLWRTRKLTSFDTRHVDESFVATIEATYGKDSDQYRVKVLGEFPTSEEHSLIRRDIADAAIDRDVSQIKGIRIWGLDIGRGGDNSALVGRQENIVYLAMEWNFADGMSTVGKVKELWDETPADERPDFIYTDSIGVGGPVADRLRELGLPAVDINVSESAPLKQVYLRLRDQLWYDCKSWFERLDCAIKIEDDKVAQKLASEVATPMALYTSLGKNSVESKPQMRSRGEASPNLGDALVMTFALEGAIGLGATRSQNSSWSKELDYDPAHVF